MFKKNSNITGVFCVLILFFCIINCANVSSGYKVKGEKVYYNKGLNSFSVLSSDSEIKEADAATFEIINKHRAKDKNKVYYETFALTDSDPATFKIIRGMYAKDKNQIYYGASIMRSDSETFEIIKEPFSKDKNSVFYSNKIISDKPQAFKILFNKGEKGYITFSTDGSKVFMDDKPFHPKEVDAPTFENIRKTKFMRDKNNVYTATFGSLRDADSQTFKVISRWSYQSTYARDKSNVYYDGSKVDGADVNSHEIIDRVYHKDKNHVYKYTKTVSDDPNNFKVPEESR